jgi:hypothetical protein
VTAFDWKPSGGDRWYFYPGDIHMDAGVEVSALENGQFEASISEDVYSPWRRIGLFDSLEEAKSAAERHYLIELL